MMLFWKIRYLDRTDREFKDRCLYLNTNTLDPITRAAVELVVENKSPGRDREILKYRHLFVEGSVESVPESHRGDWDQFRGAGPSEYFEDESGREITPDEIGQILTGNPNVVHIPRGARQHDIDLMFSPRRPLPLAKVSLDAEDVRTLTIFQRDLQELTASVLMREGPGTISMPTMMTASSPFNPRLETAVTEDEMRSFSMVFRRLYMENEPASLEKAVTVFSKAVGDHPFGKWVEGEATEYRNQLASPPDNRPLFLPFTWTFTTKRLIDVFINTQYAHQPDERRQRQMTECLAQVNGKRELLKWMFIHQIWSCSLKIANAGDMIVNWFRRYCEYHAVDQNVVNSLQQAYPGLGAAEKEDDRRKRIFHQKVEKLAADLWEQHGRPAGGPMQFLVMAREQLNEALGTSQYSPGSVS